MIHLPGVDQLLALAAPDVDAAQAALDPKDRPQYLMMEMSWLI
jgi:hypothetical protein